MTAIKTENLTKRYKDKTAVDGLNLTVEKGELFSLLGVNGAGKTTTVKMLSCLTKPTEGDAYLLGDSIISAPEKVKAKTGISPQETAVAMNLSVFDNLVFMARIYGIKNGEARSKADEFVGRFGLDEVKNSRAATLSGGMQRRLSIAMALISEPEILFLDEPTLGLDVPARRELWKIIKSLHGDVTVILTTHYMEEAEELSDRIGIMQGGRIKALGTPGMLIEKTGTKRLEDAFVVLTQEGQI